MLTFFLLFYNYSGSHTLSFIRGLLSNGNTNTPSEASSPDWRFSLNFRRLSLIDRARSLVHNETARSIHNKGGRGIPSRRRMTDLTAAPTLPITDRNSRRHLFRFLRSEVPWSPSGTTRGFSLSPQKMAGSVAFL